MYSIEWYQNLGEITQGMRENAFYNEALVVGQRGHIPSPLPVVVIHTHTVVRSNFFVPVRIAFHFSATSGTTENNENVTPVGTVSER